MSKLRLRSRRASEHSWVSMARYLNPEEAVIASLLEFDGLLTAPGIQCVGYLSIIIVPSVTETDFNYLKRMYVAPRNSTWGQLPLLSMATSLRTSSLRGHLTARVSSRSLGGSFTLERLTKSSATRRRTISLSWPRTRRGIKTFCVSSRTPTTRDSTISPLLTARLCMIIVEALSFCLAVWVLCLLLRLSAVSSLRLSTPASVVVSVLPNVSDVHSPAATFLRSRRSQNWRLRER